ncbi:MAG: response regulator, partial [Phycisphaerales bacterium]
MSTILLAEDEQVLRESLAELLQSEGYTVRQAATGSEAYEIAVGEPVDLVLTDVRMPEMDGVTLLGKLRQLAPETPVIVMTAYGTVENAVEAMQLGAWDYLLKPVQFDDVLLRIKRAFEYREISRDRRVLADQIAQQGSFHNLISEAPEMLALFEQARQLSRVKSNVLLIGESGTGKELFARAIHCNGLTRSKPFIAVNSGAIPESLIASELFGHRKGAFT